MLRRILDEFRRSPGFVSLDEMSRWLGVERSALDGMLETLVRQGKLREVKDCGPGDCRCGGDCSGLRPCPSGRDRQGLPAGGGIAPP